MNSRTEPPPKEELEQSYVIEGKTALEIGDIIHRSESNVLKWLNVYNIPRRTTSDYDSRSAGSKHYRYVEPPTKEELERLYLRERKSTPEIGDIFHCTHGLVCNWLRMYDIPIKTTSEALKGKTAGQKHIKYIEPPTKGELERLYVNDRMSQVGLSNHFQCSTPTIVKWLEMYGIPIRNASDARSGMLVGKDNPAWKDGASFEPYCPRFNEAFKESIREKFGRVCFLCPTTEEENGRKLGVHHVNYNKDCLCDDSDCEFVPLCNSCHAKTNHNRDYWESHIVAALWYRGLTGSQGS